MDDYNKPSPAAARLYRLTNLMLTVAAVVLAFAMLGGCASNKSVVDQVNMTCSRVADHVIEPMGDNCIACYEKHKAILACTASSDMDWPPTFKTGGR